jgi:hypothetical protein
MTDLLGMQVRFADGHDGDDVVDVRLAPSTRVPGPLAELVVDGLVVGRRRPGTLFGYDRYPDQGPWMIRTLVRWMHRGTGYLAWEDVDRVDWEHRVLHVRTTGLRDLTPAW